MNQEHAVQGSLLETVSKFLEAMDLSDLLREGAEPIVYFGKKLTPIEAFYNTPMYRTMLQLVVMMESILQVVIARKKFPT